MNCPQCGSIRQPGDRFCAGCGHAFEAVPSSAAPLRDAAPDAAAAPRVGRLMAQILNGLALMPAVGGFVLGMGSPAEWTQGLPSGGGNVFWLGLAGLYLIAVIAVQIVLLTRRGQDLGKIAMGLRIVKHDTGRNGGFVTNFLVRVLANSLIGGIPLIGSIYSLIDILFIFRSDSRCIHDLLAGTRVIRV